LYIRLCEPIHKKNATNLRKKKKKKKKKKLKKKKKKKKKNIYIGLKLDIH